MYLLTRRHLMVFDFRFTFMLMIRPPTAYEYEYVRRFKLELWTSPLADHYSNSNAALF